MENDVDFIYRDNERGAAIMIQTIEENGEYKTMYRLQETVLSIPSWSEALVMSQKWQNRVEAIIGTLEALLSDFRLRSDWFYRNVCLMLEHAIEEMKKYRFEQLNLFEDVSTKRTYRISREVSQTSRRKNKSDVSIYD